MFDVVKNNLLAMIENSKSLGRGFISIEPKEVSTINNNKTIFNDGYVHKAILNGVTHYYYKFNDVENPITQVKEEMPVIVDSFGVELYSGDRYYQFDDMIVAEESLDEYIKDFEKTVE